MPTTFVNKVDGQVVEATDMDQYANPVNNVESGSTYWPTSVGGTANAITVTLAASNIIPVLTAGLIINFKSTAANTGAATLQVNSLTAVAITRPDGTALQAGDIPAANSIVRAIFDGTGFQIAQEPPPAVTVPTPLFGSGSDGNVTITSNTTLARDMFFGDLTIQGGVTVYTSGFVIRCSGTFTNNGAIANSGAVGYNGLGNTTGQPGGIGAPAGTLGGGAAGGTGGNMAGNGVAGSNGDAGAAGGAGGNGHVTTGGTSDLNSLKLVNWARAILGQGWLKPNLASLLEGGSGGGGGGGSANHGAPGGGGGGGVILVAALHVAGTGAVQVQGGAGGNGAASNNCGGGGGGGGGFALVITNDTSCSWSLSASGGAGGANTGTGTVGLAGTAGYTNVITGAVEV